MAFEIRKIGMLSAETLFCVLKQEVKKKSFSRRLEFWICIHWNAARKEKLKGPANSETTAIQQLVFFELDSTAFEISQNNCR